jgi:hypothetical protein
MIALSHLATRFAEAGHDAGDTITEAAFETCTGDLLLKLRAARLVR